MEGNPYDIMSFEGEEPGEEAHEFPPMPAGLKSPFSPVLSPKRGATVASSPVSCTADALTSKVNSVLYMNNQERGGGEFFTKK